MNTLQFYFLSKYKLTKKNLLFFQDCELQNKKRKVSANAGNILTTAVYKDNAGSRFKNNFHTNDAKENVSVQCSHHITMKTPVSLNKVGTSGFVSRPSFPDAHLLLKSKTSQNIASVTNCLSAESVKFGKNSPACGLTIIRPKFLKSKIPRRSTDFTSQLRTESSELRKTFAVSNFERTGTNYVHEVLNCSKSKRAGDLKNNCTESDLYEESASDLVTGAIGGSTHFMSQTLETCVCHNKAEESNKMISRGGASKMMSNKISALAYGGTFAVTATTQTDKVVKNDAAIQTDSVISVKSCIEKLFALIDCVLRYQEQLGAMHKKSEDEVHALQNQANIVHNEMVNILNVFSQTEEDKMNSENMFEERNNHSSDQNSGYSHKDLEVCFRTPLRRSARIAAQRDTAGNKSVPSTPVHLELDGAAQCLSAHTIETPSAVKLSKSENMYKGLCSSFRFLMTPQSTRRPLAKTPKATPNQILKERLRDQILSLYN